MIAEFAQIVGLLAAFSSGRTRSESAELVEFLEWLVAHNHGDLRSLIEGNQSTAVSIKSMLNLGFEDIGEKLDRISGQLADLAHRSYGTEELASSFSSALISDQAYKILSQMEENQSEFFLISKAINAPTHLTLSPGPGYEPEEARFLHDDLETLVDLGLLQLDYNSRGDPLYRYTRAASKLFQKAQ